MKNLLIALLIGAAVWKFYTNSISEHSASAPTLPDLSASSAPISSPPKLAPSPYSCDGRTYCSQMSSCAEAKFFLRNCPGTKMDGNMDGIPCEQQHCR